MIPNAPVNYELHGTRTQRNVKKKSPKAIFKGLELSLSQIFFFLINGINGSPRIHCHGILRMCKVSQPIQIMVPCVSLAVYALALFWNRMASLRFTGNCLSNTILFFKKICLDTSKARISTPHTYTGAGQGFNVQLMGSIQ